MGFEKVFHVSLLALTLSAVACGRPNPGQAIDKTDNRPTNKACSSSNDCSGDEICVGGECKEDTTTPTACVDDGDCEGSDFCHYTQIDDDGWVPGTEGVCAAACSDSDDCSFGQLCDNGQCYTLLSCNRANNNLDCPPGEVCDGNFTSNAPPDECNFANDCPAGWVCNVDGTCLDPNGGLGDCDTASDCSTVSGCASNSCTCDAGDCVPIGGCEDEDDCPAGNYCNNTLCRPATACTSQNNCSPLGLVCEGGYCVNPDPCGTGNTCPSGQECKTNFSPALCFPTGVNDCNNDTMCGAGEYCDLFTGQCETGCRSDADCAGQCGASATCSCDSARNCSASNVGTPGEACTTDVDCTGGTLCAFDDPNAGLGCGLFPVPGLNCLKSCRVVCDILTSQLLEQCPSGQSCGGGDATQAIIQQLFGSLFSSSSGSVCY